MSSLIGGIETSDQALASQASRKKCAPREAAHL